MQCRLSIGVGGFGLGSPTRALVKVVPGFSLPFQQSSEYRNREKAEACGSSGSLADVPSHCSVGHFDSRYRAGGRGAKKEEMPGPAINPCTEPRSHGQCLPSTTLQESCSPRSAPSPTDGILLPIPHFRLLRHLHRTGYSQQWKGGILHLEMSCLVVSMLMMQVQLQGILWAAKIARGARAPPTVGSRWPTWLNAEVLQNTAATSTAETELEWDLGIDTRRLSVSL